MNFSRLSWLRMSWLYFGCWDMWIKLLFTCKLDPTGKLSNEGAKLRQIVPNCGVDHCARSLSARHSQPYQSALFYTKTELHCAVLYCSVMYCTVLYFTVLSCIVLCCTVPYWLRRTALWNWLLLQGAWLRLNYIEYRRFQCPLKTCW